MLSLWPKQSPHPRLSRWWWLPIAAVALSMGPWLIGVALRPADRGYIGTYPKAPGDTVVYYRYIDEGRTSGPFMIDAFTTEEHPAILWQPLWWALGRVAEVFQLETATIFALARALLAALTALTISWAARQVFSHRRTQNTAAWLGYFGAGLGGLLTFFTPALGEWMPAPYYDLWVSEGYPWLSGMASPHFLLVTIGLLLAVVTVEYTWTFRWARWLAGPALLLAISIHPFHLLTLAMLWAGLTVWDVARRAPDWRARFGRRLLMGCWALPAILYYFLTFDLELMNGRAIQNINPTYIWPMILGVAPVGLVALWGLSRRRSGPAAFVGWGLALAAVVFLPLDFQRRFFHPASLVLAFAAAPVFSAWLEKNDWRRWLTVGLFGVMLLSPVVVLRDSYRFAASNAQSPYQSLSYETADFAQARAQLRAHPEWSPVLTGRLNGNLLAATAPIRPYAAHAVETLDYRRKEAEIERFFGTMSTAEQQQFLRQNQICSVLVSPYERSYGAAWTACPIETCAVRLTTPTITLYSTGICPD